MKPNHSGPLYEGIPSQIIGAGFQKEVYQSLICETRLTVRLNGTDIMNLLCLPLDLEYLALGYLVTEGVIDDRKMVTGLDVNRNPFMVSVTTSNGHEWAARMQSTVSTLTSSGAKRINPMGKRNSAVSDSVHHFTLSISDITFLLSKIDAMDHLYVRTHGVHSAALCSATEVVYFTTDIGRHNTMDRIAGKCLWEDIPTDDKILFCSGRFSSEMVAKLAAIGVPIAVTRAMPTTHAVEMAGEVGITLMSIRDINQIAIYSHRHRITG